MKITNIISKQAVKAKDVLEAIHNTDFLGKIELNFLKEKIKIITFSGAVYKLSPIIDSDYNRIGTKISYNGKIRGFLRHNVIKELNIMIDVQTTLSTAKITTSLSEKPVNIEEYNTLFLQYEVKRIEDGYSNVEKWNDWYKDSSFYTIFIEKNSPRVQ